MKNTLENPNMVLYDKLPKDWKIVRTKFIFNIINGSTPTSTEELYWNGEINWITPEDVSSVKERFILEANRKITQEGYNSCGTTLVPKNSIVLTTRAPVGNIAIAGISLCTNQGCKSLVSKKEFIYSIFFYYQFIARRSELESMSSGTTFQELNTDSLSSFSLILPPLPTQKIIANFLDKETARIDSLISAKERFIGLLEEKRKATITEAVTRGLSPDVKMKDSGVEWLGKVPKHWEIERAKWLFTERNEKTDDDEGELLTVSHITGVTKRSEKDVNMFEAETTEGYKICKKGELVINTLWAWMGAMGISPVDGIASPAYHVYTLSDKLLSEYVDAIVRTPIFASEITKYSKGVWSSRLRLYPEGFYETFFAVPPISEQKQIVDFIRKQTTRIDKLIQKTNESIELLKERRTALIGEAVTGKLKIGEGE